VISSHGFLDRVLALEEVFARFHLFGTVVGIQVFVKEFPHVVGERQNFQVFGVLESSFGFHGHVSVVFGFFHNFTDEPLLAVQVVVVEFFVDVLEQRDPLDDVQSVEVVSVIVGSGVVITGAISA